jgi:hypothetical protein
MIARLRATMPEVMLSLPLSFLNPQHWHLFLSGLRLAIGETLADRRMIAEVCLGA